MTKPAPVVTLESMPSGIIQKRASGLLEALLDHGLLLGTGVPGIWGRAAAFERVVDAVERLISHETRDDAASYVRFPPVISRADFERSEFLKSFPHLAGVIHAFDGRPDEHQELLSSIESGGDWSNLVRMTDVVLTPAACYPVYPMLAGELAAGGRLCDVSSYCFRYEPSLEPTRMVSFRMREQVRAGTPDEVLAFRERWMARATKLFAELAVPASSTTASDPFFGRGGRLLALAQREQRLKFELVVPIISDTDPTPVMSFNYHQDHFGRVFGIRTSDGATAHTACVGFGLERIVLALFKTHGFISDAWPKEVRSRLWP